MRYSLRTIRIGILGILIILFLGFMVFSASAGGHVPGITVISPGNVGLVIDNYRGVVEKQTMPAGAHWQGMWETVLEVPTAQQTISLTKTDKDADGNIVDRSVAVNTVTNMLTVDVSTQYQIDPDKIDDLYNTYQDQFEDLRSFEATNLEPAVKGAINFAVGDEETATILTTVGKQLAEQKTKDMLNAEWAPRGIVFSQVMIRGIDQDDASKQLLSTTLGKLQDIQNAKLALQQQLVDNQTVIAQAIAEAKVNQLQNSTLTDLYVQDQELSRVKTVYVPSNDLMGLLK